MSSISKLCEIGTLRAPACTLHEMICDNYKSITAESSEGAGATRTFFSFFYHQPRNLRSSKKHEKTESKEIQYLDQFIASIDHVQFPPCCRRWSDSCRSIRKIENAKFDGTHFCSYVQSNDPKGYRFYFPLFKFKHFQNNLNIFCKNVN